MNKTLRAAGLAAAGALAVGGALLGGTALGGTPSAHASPGYGSGSSAPDISGYLAALKSEGIPYDPESVPTGMKVCTLLRKGVSEGSIVSYIEKDDPAEFGSPFMSRMLTIVVSDAHTYLCPDAGSSGGYGGGSPSYPSYPSYPSESA